MAINGAPDAMENPVEVPRRVQDVEEPQAKEASVLSKWEAAEMTIREAALELGIGYGEFLELLAVRGIPVERGPLAFDAIQAALHQLADKSR